MCIVDEMLFLRREQADFAVEGRAGLTEHVECEYEGGGGGKGGCSVQNGHNE